eukprot:jgi/Chlat1/6220/Chrsp44S05810
MASTSAAVSGAAAARCCGVAHKPAVAQRQPAASVVCRRAGRLEARRCLPSLLPHRRRQRLQAAVVCCASAAAASPSPPSSSAAGIPFAQDSHERPQTPKRPLFWLPILRALPVVALVTAVRLVFPQAAGAHSVTLTRPVAIPSSEVLGSAWTGLVAGCLHTLTGPDHLAALAPLSIGRSKLQSAWVGALWGCGHEIGQIIFGILFLLLKERLHIELIRTWSSRVAGLTLLAIGALGVREAQTPVEVVAEAAQGISLSPDGTAAAAISKQRFNIATFTTGIVHGLQPDALLVILPALALPKAAGAAFLVTFLIGTVCAMGSYTAFIGASSEALSSRVPWVTKRLSLISSIVAVVVGLLLLVGNALGIDIL